MAEQFVFAGRETKGATEQVKTVGGGTGRVMDLDLCAFGLA